MILVEYSSILGNEGSALGHPRISPAVKAMRQAQNHNLDAHSKFPDSAEQSRLFAQKYEDICIALLRQSKRARVRIQRDPKKRSCLSFQLEAKGAIEILLHAPTDQFLGYIKNNGFSSPEKHQLTNLVETALSSPLPDHRKEQGLRISPAQFHRR